VLVDTPPVLPVADTLVIGRIASGAILVTQARATATAAVQQAKDLLVRNQTRIFGVVVNRVRQDDADAEYGYGYGYGYGARSETGDDSLGEGGNSHTLSGANGSDPVTKWLSRTSAGSRTGRPL
jgi:Mrp family chromosome partitioning ATPase